MGSSQQDVNPGTLSITIIFEALQSLAWCLWLKEKDIVKCTGQAWCFNDTTESQARKWKKISSYIKRAHQYTISFLSN